MIAASCRRRMKTCQLMAAKAEGACRNSPQVRRSVVARQHLSCMGSMYSENAIAAVPPKYAAQNAAETPRRLLLECTLV